MADLVLHSLVISVVRYCHLLLLSSSARCHFILMVYLVEEKDL